MEAHGPGQFVRRGGAEGKIKGYEPILSHLRTVPRPDTVVLVALEEVGQPTDGYERHTPRAALLLRCTPRSPRRRARGRHDQENVVPKQRLGAALEVLGETQAVVGGHPISRTTAGVACLAARRGSASTVVVAQQTGNGPDAARVSRSSQTATCSQRPSGISIRQPTPSQHRRAVRLRIPHHPRAILQTHGDHTGVGDDHRVCAGRWHPRGVRKILALPALEMCNRRLPAVPFCVCLICKLIVRTASVHRIEFSSIGGQVLVNLTYGVRHDTLLPSDRGVRWHILRAHLRVRRKRAMSSCCETLTRTALRGWNTLRVGTSLYLVSRVDPVRAVQRRGRDPA
jgi:hypothetical protein